MKRLFICNTYYQLIIAIQLKLTLFKEDEVSVWISDCSVNSETVADRLNETNIFNYVNKIYTKHSKFAIKDIYLIFKNNFGENFNIDIELYDEIIFYNLDLFMYSIDDIYKRKGHTVIWSKMEEGLVSYSTDYAIGTKVKATRTIRKLTKRTDVANEIKNYYCFFPDLKTTHREWSLIKIPPISEKINELKKILNYIFDYKPIDFKQKYIFFASSSDIDGQPFGETEFVLNLAQKVGAENLLVKMHPRDTRKIYEEHGIQVMKNSYVPWEVIQLNWENTEHILLTVTSGAFINITSLLNQSTKGYFLYSYIKDPKAEFAEKTNKISSMLDRLHILGIAKNISALKENRY